MANGAGRLSPFLWLQWVAALAIRCADFAPLDVDTSHTHAGVAGRGVAGALCSVTVRLAGSGRVVSEAARDRLGPRAHHERERERHIL